MLGDKIGTMTLQETNKPMDSGKYGLPAMDITAEGSGTMLGHDVQSMGAFTAEMRPDGSWAGNAYAGVVMCAEGVATYKATGGGNQRKDGGTSFRGGAIFETTSEALSELNGKFYAFTYEADADGKAVWELYPFN